METRLAWIPMASGQHGAVDVIRSGESVNSYIAVNQPRAFTLIAAARPRFGVVSVMLLKLALRFLTAPA